MKRKLIGGIALLLIAGGVLTIVTTAALHRRSDAGRGGSSSDGDSFVGHGDWRNVKWIKEFTLTERSGRMFHTKDLDGQVWVVSFFFTSCPASCKEQNDHIRRLHKTWGPKGVTFVSITCDPETDTTERLRQYAHTFDAHEEHWLFLTGELLHLRRIGSEVFSLAVDKGFHSDTLTIVDRWGKVRGHFNWKDPLKRTELEDSLGKLLAETEPPAEEKQDEDNPAKTEVDPT